MAVEVSEQKIKLDRFVKIFVYPPSYPRRYFTVQLIGEWHKLVEYKSEIIEQVNLLNK